MNKLKLSLFAAVLAFANTAAGSPVVELFTSQGCYSCPPADEFLADIIEKQPDVVALEYHVDYWDDLHYGAAGVWKDPFSDPAYTDRQRRYNAQGLEGRQGVYTPQMVINGHTGQVGSSRRAVGRALKSKPPEVKLSATVSAGRLSLEIKNNYKSGSTLWLAVFDRRHVTKVANGENQGKTMVNHHVVRKLVPLSEWQGKKGSLAFEIPAEYQPQDNRGCAVLIQDAGPGEILGAAYCKQS